MEKNEKSPADRQGENRRLLLQASHKDARMESKNRVQQKYCKWREKKRREYMDGGYKHTFWENLIYFTLVRENGENMDDKINELVFSLIGSFVGIAIARWLFS